MNYRKKKKSLKGRGGLEGARTHKKGTSKLAAERQRVEKGLDLMEAPDTVGRGRL